MQGGGALGQVIISGEHIRLWRSQNELMKAFRGQRGRATYVIEVTDFKYGVKKDPQGHLCVAGRTDGLMPSAMFEGGDDDEGDFPSLEQAADMARGVKGGEPRTVVTALYEAAIGKDDGDGATAAGRQQHLKTG